jgi:hypothetical protein
MFSHNQFRNGDKSDLTGNPEPGGAWGISVAGRRVAVVIKRPTRIAVDTLFLRGAWMRDVLYCPGCQRRLQLPDEAYGKPVQCPSCQRVFTAEPNLTNPPASANPARGAAAVPTRPPPTRSYDDPADYDRPRSRRRSRDDDDDDGRFRPRRPAAHRGGEILTFGLLALIPCPLTSIIFGIIAWMMANADLKEMRSGRMDRDGEGLTQWGRVLGILGLVFFPGLFCCLVAGNIR